MIQNFLVLPKGRDIKAARNYLDWNQMKLAVSCDLNIGTITAIEKEERYPTVENLKKIAQVFLDEGVRFHSQGGFIHDNEVVKIYEGKEAYLKILEDILKVYKKDKNQNKVLLLGANEKKCNDEVIRKKKEMYKMGIYFKVLIPSDIDDYVLGPLEDYRKINKDYFFSNDVVVIYENKIAISFLEGKTNNYKLVSMDHKGLSNEMAKYFKNLWGKADKIKKSSIKQIYFK